MVDLDPPPVLCMGSVHHLDLNSRLSDLKCLRWHPHSSSKGCIYIPSCAIWQGEGWPGSRGVSTFSASTFLGNTAPPPPQLYNSTRQAQGHCAQWGLDKYHILLHSSSWKYGKDQAL